jgi:hypothetical protein
MTVQLANDCYKTSKSNYIRVTLHLRRGHESNLLKIIRALPVPVRFDESYEGDEGDWDDRGSETLSDPDSSSPTLPLSTALEVEMELAFTGRIYRGIWFPPSGSDFTTGRATIL